MAFKMWIILLVSLGGLYGFSTLDETNQEKVQDTIGGVAGSMASVINKTVAEKLDEIQLSKEYEKLGKPSRVETSEYTVQFPCQSDNDCNLYISECENNCTCIEENCWREKV